MIAMYKRSFLFLLILVVAFGCANQQKEDAEDVAVEEISLAVTGMT